MHVSVAYTHRISTIIICQSFCVFRICWQGTIYCRNCSSQSNVFKGHSDGISDFSIWGQDVISVSRNKIGLSSLSRSSDSVRNLLIVLSITTIRCTITLHAHNSLFLFCSRIFHCLEVHWDFTTELNNMLLECLAAGWREVAFTSETVFGWSWDKKLVSSVKHNYSTVFTIISHRNRRWLPEDLLLDLVMYWCVHGPLCTSVW